MAQVRYIVTDVETSIAFYEKLGFSLVEQYGPAMATLACGDLRLWVAGPAASASKPMLDGCKPEPGGWGQFVLTVDDIEEVSKSLQAQGVVFRNEVLAGLGGRQVLCEDPSGNVVELLQPGSGIRGD